jgi:hypothetical protein
MALETKDMFGIMVAGAVGLMLAPVVLPTIVRLGRPTAKSAMKAALLLQQQLREGAAVFAESVEDLAAEARAELEAEAAAAAAHPAAAIVPAAVKGN